MRNRKQTKRALIASALSVLMCISMLIGSTFAWFTDSAATGVSNIVAGTLDIALEMKDEGGNWVTAEGKTLDFIKADGSDEILWEPGCTYKLPDLRIVNNGNLHLKYMLTITGIDGDVKLNEAIEWTYGSYTVGSDYVALAPNDTSETITIQGHMKENAGSEYQGLSIEGIAITVFATQFNNESDSFGPDYDKDAPTLVMIGDTRYETLDAAIAAAQNGDTIDLSGFFTLPTDGSLINKELTFAKIKDSIAVIDMKNVATGQSTGGASLTFKGLDVKFGDQNYMGIQHAAKVVYEDCTLYGKQFMYAPTVEFKGCEFINYADYAVWTYGSTEATFTDCTFTTGGKAVLVYSDSGTITANHTFTNCTFNSNGQLATDKAAVEVGDGASANYTITLNNCTANGFAANRSNSPLWGNKNNMPKERLAITVDGVAQPIYAYVNINSIADYVAFGNAVTNNTQYQGISVANNSEVYAVLNTDIDYKNVTGLANNAIGNGSNTLYCGTFDGNGHTISNVTLGGNWAYTCAMFRTVGDGFTFKNVTVDTVNNVADGRKTSGVAAIVGLSGGGDITFDNVTVKNANLNGRAAVGVLMGGAQQTSVVNITNCSLIDCTVATSTHQNANADYIGAFVGNYQGGATSGGNAPAVINIDDSNTVTNCVDGNGAALPNCGQSST